MGTLKNVLLVGAGSVGQVFGWHLQRAGAGVSFLVRPRHAETTRRGFNLYRLGRWRRATTLRLDGAGVLTSVDEMAAAGPWDAVVVCVSSTALRAGPWLSRVARAAGDAGFCLLQPGLEDRAFALEHIAQERLTWGMIGLAAYAAPLPGEHLPAPGTAFWVPPLAPLPFSGPLAPCVARALTKGGLRSVVHADVPRAVASGAAILDVLVAGLECADWRLARLCRDPVQHVLCAAAREAGRVSARRLGFRPALAPRLLRPRHVRLVARIAPRLVPFDLEAYLRAHFSKVSDQTRLQLATWLDAAHRFGLPNAALGELLARVDAARSRRNTTNPEHADAEVQRPSREVDGTRDRLSLRPRGVLG